MTDIKSIIELLDDPNPIVRENVERQIRERGPSIEIELVDLWKTLDKKKIQVLTQLISQLRIEYLNEHWASWYSISNEYERIEKALLILSNYIGGFISIPFPEVLDRIAIDFLDEYKRPTPFDLAIHLFENNMYHSIGGKEFSDINMSNLNYVALAGQGLPISLCLLYMLVGYRVGFKIDGVVYPKHFLTRFRYHDRMFLVDCFHQGRIVDMSTVAEFESLSTLQKEFWLHGDSEAIVRRVIYNCINVYSTHKQKTQIDIMNHLLDDICDYRNSYRDARILFNQTQNNTVLSIGNCVLHTRYGYRGVIVDFDMECRAGDEWFFNNQTQPDRLQPWYHILVDGTRHVTYAAEANLEKDESNGRVFHPLIKTYFNDFQNGSYIRNSTPWEKSIL